MACPSIPSTKKKVYLSLTWAQSFNSWQGASFKPLEKGATSCGYMGKTPSDSCVIEDGNRISPSGNRNERPFFCQSSYSASHRYRALIKGGNFKSAQRPIPQNCVTRGKLRF